MSHINYLGPELLEVRTSETHPIRVDWLPLRGPGHVGMTFAPGKRCFSMGRPVQWDRSLMADMAELSSHGVDRLVSLLEDSDFEKIGVKPTAFFLAASKEGIAVRRFAVPDGGVPTQRQMRDIMQAIKVGREGRWPVAIHCVGGLGRTGVVAGCLLRLEGYSAGKAIEILERLRGPNCPENAKQRAAIYAFES